MPPPLKDCDAAIDYAAFMLAMVFARHNVNHENANRQWNAENLAEKNNKMEYSDSPNFAIDSRALKQGMSLFSTEFIKRGIEKIEVFKEESKTREFFSLSEHVRSIEIKFSSYFSPPNYTESELLLEIKKIRDQILKRCYYHPSIHETPAAVLGCLYYRTTCSSQCDDMNNDETTTSSAKGDRLISKSPDRRSVRSIKQTVNSIIKKVEGQVGEKHALFYLQSAIKKTQGSGQKNHTPESGLIESRKRKNTNNEEEVDVEQSIGKNPIGAVADDVRITNALKEIPSKYITYSTSRQEKCNETTRSSEKCVK
jgi:hypothetical protein